MRISKIWIRNWKTLKDVSFSLEDFTTILGENGTGKSSVIECIEWFFTGSKDEKSLREVEILFTEIDESKTEALVEEIKKEPEWRILRKESDGLYFIGTKEAKIKNPKGVGGPIKWKPELWMDLIVIKANESLDKKKILAKLLDNDNEASIEREAFLKAEQERLENKAPAKKLNDELSKMINLKINISLDKVKSFSRPEYQIEFDKWGDSIDLDYLNDGDFRATIIALTKASLPPSRPTFFIIDEIEMSQHSARVQNFVRNLDFYSKNEHSQVLISTHHYNAVDLKHSIKVFRLNDNYQTRIEELNLNEAEKKLLRQNIILKEFFFLKKAVFVEGENDWHAFNEIINLMGIEIPDGTSFYWAKGRSNIQTAINICKKIGLEYWAILDGDKNNLNKAGKPRAHEECKKFLEANSITFKEDHSYYPRFSLLKNTLESGLAEIHPSNRRVNKFNLTTLFEFLEEIENFDEKSNLILTIKTSLLSYDNPVFKTDEELGKDHEYYGLSLDERLYLLFNLSAEEIAIVKNS